MRTVIPIGGSVRLVPVAEIARGLRMSARQTHLLLCRLGIPTTVDYGPETMVNLAPLEAAIFRDLWIEGDTDREMIRLYQLQAAIDYGVLDRAALQKKLRQFTAEIYKIHERHDDPEDEPAEATSSDGTYEQRGGRPTCSGEKRDRPESG